MDKLYNILMICLIGYLSYMSNENNKMFVDELRKSREVYVQAINNIDTIKEDVSFIKNKIIERGGV